MAHKSRHPSHRRKPWVARVRLDYVEYHLGRFRTKRQAIRAENEFRARFPDSYTYRRAVIDAERNGLLQPGELYAPWAVLVLDRSTDG